jgi:hypothetical protein
MHLMLYASSAIAKPGRRPATPSLQRPIWTDDVLGGIVAWQLIVYAPPERLPVAFA